MAAYYSSHPDPKYTPEYLQLIKYYVQYIQNLQYIPNNQALYGGNPRPLSFDDVFKEDNLMPVERIKLAENFTFSAECDLLMKQILEMPTPPIVLN